MVITDAPYNVVINGNVSGLGRTQHREFAMASGEMSPFQFIAFLVRVMSLLAEHSLDGSIHYHFMDWRHVYEIIIAGRRVYTELKNLAVWNKTKSAGRAGRVASRWDSALAQIAASHFRPTAGERRDPLVDHASDTAAR